MRPFSFIRICITRIAPAILFFTIYCCNNSQESANTQDTSSVSLSVRQISAEIRKNPRNPGLFIKRAEVYLTYNETDSAVNDFLVATRLDSTNTEVFIRLSELYILKGNSGTAMEILEKCNRINPYNADVLVKIATIYFYIKDYKSSLKFLDQAKSADPYNPSVFFIRGMIHFEKQEINASIFNFQKASEYDPEMFDAFMMLGLIHSRNNDSLALQYYRTASFLRPADPQPVYNAGVFLQDNLNFDEALKSYRHIIENIDSSYFPAFFNQGYIYMVYIKDYKTGIQYFDSSLKLKPGYIEAIYNKGYCYEMLKKYDKARECYLKANEISVNYELAIQGLNRIDKKL